MTFVTSIIICTAGKPESLSRTLESLSKVNEPAYTTLELIVIDNQPNTAHAFVLAAKLSHFNVKYIEETRRGLSIARNTGLAAATGEVIVFTDDDLRFREDWIEQITKPIVKGEADAVAGAVGIAEHLKRPWLNRQPYRFAELLKPQEGGLALHGANMAFHKRVLQRVPLFDTELGAGALGFGEETLFSYQLSDAGYKIAFSLDSEVTHHFEPSRLLRRNLQEAAYNLGKSNGYLNYHWFCRKFPAIGLRRIKKASEVLFYNVVNKVKSGGVEGCESKMLWSLHFVGMYDQYLIESKKPRKYIKTG